MAAPIDLRNDFDSVSLRRLAKRTRDATQSRRLLALAEVYDGGSRTDASADRRRDGLQRIIRDADHRRALGAALQRPRTRTARSGGRSRRSQAFKKEAYPSERDRTVASRSSTPIHRRALSEPCARHLAGRPGLRPGGRGWGRRRALAAQGPDRAVGSWPQNGIVRHRARSTQAAP